MRRTNLTLLVSLALALQGCASDESKPEPRPNPPPAAKPAPPPNKPADKPTPPPQPKDEEIVIKGSGKKDEPALTAAQVAEKERQAARTAELERKARESQGKGDPGGSPSPSTPSSGSKDDDGKILALRRRSLQNQIASDDDKISKLEDEKKALTIEVRNARTHVMEKKYSDPDRGADIEKQLTDLKADKAQAKSDLDALSGSKKSDGSGPPPDKGDGSGPPPGKSDGQ